MAYPFARRAAAGIALSITLGAVDAAAQFTVNNGTTLTARQTVSPGQLGSVAMGGVINLATGGNEAVRINNSGATTLVSISNSGTIQTSNTATGRAIDNTTTGNALVVAITNGGLISATTSDTIRLRGSTASITITNSGTIQANGTIAAAGTNVVCGTLTCAGTVVSNQALDLRAVANTNTGGTTAITNSGLIQAANNDAIRTGLGTTVITNTGTIRSTGFFNSGSGSADAIDIAPENTAGVATVQSRVTITNSGLIQGARHGITADSGEGILVINNAGGTIRGSNGSGVGFDGTTAFTNAPTVRNFGLITGDYAGAGNIKLRVQQGGNDLLSDTTNGDGDGVDIDGIGIIENSGTIQGTGAGGVDSGGRTNGADGIAMGGGTITNNAGALIQGVSAGILIDDGANGSAFGATTITNAGTITSSAGRAIELVGVFNDTLTNTATGLLSSGSATLPTVQMGDGNDTVTTSGTITSASGIAIDLGAGNNNLTIQGGRITGRVLGGTGSDTVLMTAGTVSVTSGAAIDLGAGANSLTIQGGQISGSVVLGGGEDAVVISGGTISVASGSAIDLGLGNDSLTIQGGQISGNIVGGGGTDALRLLIASGQTFTYASAASGFATASVETGTTAVDGSLQAGAISVSPGATLAGTGSLTGAVTNSGILSLSGTITGNVITTGTITGNPTLVGNLTISSGGSVTNGIKFGAGTSRVTLTTGGSAAGAFTTQGTTTLVLDGSGTGSTAAAFTGFAGITKQGTGTWTLTGANTGTGSISIAAGTLIGSTTSLTGDIAVAGQLIFDQSAVGTGTYSRVLSGAGPVDLRGGGLTLTGASTGTGALTVRNGAALTVSGSIAAPVTIDAGARLTGTGRIAGAVTNSGTISPGSGTSGRLVVGSYSGSGILATSIGPTTAATTLQVTGTANLTGGTLLITVQPAFYPAGSSYSLVEAGQVSGQFATITQSISPFLALTPLYSSTGLTVLVGPGASYASLATGGASTGVASALDVIGRTAQLGSDAASVLGVINGLTATGAQAAFRSMSGQSAANLSTPGLATGGRFASVTGQRLGALRSGSTGSLLAAVQYASAPLDGIADIDSWRGAQAQRRPSQAADDQTGGGAWIRGLGIFDRTGSRGEAGGYRSSTGGVQAGVDYAVIPGLFVGLSAGYSASSVTFADGGSSGAVKSYQIGLYGGWEPRLAGFEGLFLSASVGYGHNENKLDRLVTVGTLQRRADGSFNSHAFTVSGEVGYRFALVDKLEIEPALGVRWSRLRENGFTETGADFLNLSYGSRTSTSTVTSVGAKLTRTFTSEEGLTWTPEVRAAWEREHGDIAKPASASFAAAPALPFSPAGVSRGRDAAVLGVGLTLGLDRTVDAFLDFDASLRSNETSQVVRGGFRIKF